MNRSLFLILLSAFFTGPLVTAGAEQISFYADTMTGIAGNKSDSTILSGNAFVKTESMEISADSITLNGEDFRFISADGSISAKNTETNMDFTCGNLAYDRKTKIAILKNSVHLVDNENNVTADSQVIEYNQDTETAILQIDITLKQKDNICTGAYAIYRKKNQMLELSGDPEIVQGKDMFRAQNIILNLNSQEIVLDGRVSGTVTDSDRNKDKTAGKTQQSDRPDESAGVKPDSQPDNGDRNESAR
jgi:lipopolysaccharide export system protein LptA